LFCSLRVFVEDADGLSPGRFLAVVNLPEVEHVPLYRIAATHAS